MGIASSAKVFPWAKLVHEGDSLSVGEHSQIDDFVFLNAGKRCSIGRFVHVASFVSIIGGGEFTIGDFSGLSAGCRVITGSDDYSGPFLTNPTVPREFSNYDLSHVHIGKHVIVGTSTVLYPGVSIPDGVAIGAGCHVRVRLEPWGVYGGSPLRRIGERDGEAIRAKGRLVLERFGLPTAG
jgi:acetyltransferase-like isoleucine patch superfamily enzyme